jgi:hypothetical protein
MEIVSFPFLYHHRSFLFHSDKHLMCNVCIVYILSSACNFVYFVSFIIKHEIFLLLCCFLFLPGFSTFSLPSFGKNTHRFDFAHALKKRVKSERRKTKHFKSHPVRRTFYRKSFKSFCDKLSPPENPFPRTTKFMQYSLEAVDKRKTVAGGT